MSIYDNYKPASEDDTYLKLGDGKSARVRIASEPYIFNSVYEDKETGEKNISQKYAWVVFNKDATKAQVLQLPVSGYRMIAGLASDSDWGDPTKYDVKVSREGTKLQTKYQVTPSPNKDPLTADQKEAVGKVEIEKLVKGALPLAQFVEQEQPTKKSGESVSEKPSDVVIEDLKDDEPVDLSEIPF